MNAVLAILILASAAYLDARMKLRMEKLMANQQEFDAALDALIQAEAQRDKVVTQALQDLMAKVNSGAQIDLSAELAKVVQLQQAAADITQQATADDPGPTDVTPTPSA